MSPLRHPSPIQKAIATEAETLCQKSDVAICLAHASGVQSCDQRKVGGTSSNEPRKEQGCQQRS